MYEYRIKEFIKIYDGDTVTILIDLGFGVYRTETIRLLYIDTPELRGDEREEGLKSRDRLRQIIADAILEGKSITVKTIQDKKGKYGRYLGEIFIEGAETSVNTQLLTEGFAEKY